MCQAVGASLSAKLMNNLRRRKQRQRGRSRSTPFWEADGTAKRLMLNGKELGYVYHTVARGRYEAHANVESSVLDGVTLDQAAVWIMRCHQVLKLLTHNSSRSWSRRFRHSLTHSRL